MGRSSSKEKSPPSPDLSEPWRKIEWSKEKLLQDLNNFRPRSEVLRILPYGPTGAGKSCFINSVQRSLLGRNFIGALENSNQGGSTSFTLSMKTHKIKKSGGDHYPFVLCNIMGLEADDAHGIHTKDINNILKGRILDDYTFNPAQPIPKDNPKYRDKTELCDKVHCLVCIVPADTFSIMDERVLSKMKLIRDKASKMNIPQVIVLTKVDEACLLVGQDLKRIYHSKKIEEKVVQCSQKLGHPVNSIYPVKNYSKEITNVDDIDTLILMAMRDIVNFANDYVEDLKDH